MVEDSYVLFERMMNTEPIKLLNNGGDPKTFKIIGAAMAVHSYLGCGFLEAVYQESLELEFIHSENPYEREVELAIYYKGKRLKTY